MVPGRFSWFFRVPALFSWFQVVFSWCQVSFHGFHGSRLIFHGSRSIFMVFHGSRLVIHGSRSVFMVFRCSRLVFHFSYWEHPFWGLSSNHNKESTNIHKSWNWAIESHHDVLTTAKISFFLLQGIIHNVIVHTLLTLN